MSDESKDNMLKDQHKIFNKFTFQEKSSGTIKSRQFARPENKEFDIESEEEEEEEGRRRRRRKHKR